MTDQERINILVASGLKGAAGCEVVKSNIAGAPIPAYPYISFTILNTETRKGTYSGNTERYMPLTQTWSFTVQGDDDDGTFRTAMRARDWLEEGGRMYLNDNGIVVRKVGPVINRDTLLTVEYEYRKGFDAVLCLTNRVRVPDTETIENAEIGREDQ